MIQVVTIDGPAGAGKSSVARLLAKRLGWRFLDTGAMYRAVTLAALRRHVDLRSETDLQALVATLRVEITSDDVYLDGEVVTEAIRTTEVTRLTYRSANCPAVRQRLVSWQRGFAEVAKSIVTEGRDQGTIVFPDALKKFFLTADQTERARRRHSELVASGVTTSLEQILDQVRHRDDGDHARAIAPMIPAPDARIINSTGLTIDQVVSLMETEVRDQLASLQRSFLLSSAP